MVLLALVAVSFATQSLQGVPWGGVRKFPFTSGTVTSIVEGVMMAFSQDPLTDTGTVSLDTAALRVWIEGSVGDTTAFHWDTAEDSAYGIYFMYGQGDSVLVQVINGVGGIWRSRDSVLFEAGGNVYLWTTDAESIAVTKGYVDSRVAVATDTHAFHHDDTTDSTSSVYFHNGTGDTVLAHVFLGRSALWLGSTMGYLAVDDSALYTRTSTATGIFATALGKTGSAADPYSTVSGGFTNTASASFATVGGGYSNTADGTSATVGGGRNNVAVGLRSTVGGGYNDTAKAMYGTVSGGYSNLAGDAATDTGATIGGGYDNSATAQYTTVGGGHSNAVSAVYSTIGGGQSNIVSGERATIAGGSSSDATANYSTVGGGYSHIASGGFSTVAGGNVNTASGNRSTVGGGSENTASGYGAVVPGGKSNVASGDYSTSIGIAATTSADTSVHISLSAAGGDLAQANTMAITGGKVGIGTVTPGFDFDVDDGSNTGAMRTWDFVGNDIYLYTATDVPDTLPTAQTSCPTIYMQNANGLYTLTLECGPPFLELVGDTATVKLGASADGATQLHMFSGGAQDYADTVRVDTNRIYTNGHAVIQDSIRSALANFTTSVTSPLALVDSANFVNGISAARYSGDGSNLTGVVYADSAGGSDRLAGMDTTGLKAVFGDVDADTKAQDTANAALALAALKLPLLKTQDTLAAIAESDSIDASAYDSGTWLWVSSGVGGANLGGCQVYGGTAGQVLTLTLLAGSEQLTFSRNGAGGSKLWLIEGDITLDISYTNFEMTCIDGTNWIQSRAVVTPGQD